MRKIFSDQLAFIDINKYSKGALAQISTVVLPAHHTGSQSVISNRIFLNIYLNAFFGVLNFGNKSAMKLSFFLKMFQIYCRFQKWKKNWENISGFWDNRIWNGCCQLSLLRKEYLWRPVNALRNSSKTLHMSKRDFLLRNFFHSDQ